MLGCVCVHTWGSADYFAVLLLVCISSNASCTSFAPVTMKRVCRAHIVLEMQDSRCAWHYIM